MRILYITDCWTGLKDIIYYGKEQANGMPAFIKPLQELCRQGNIVDLYVIDGAPAEQVNIHEKWRTNLNVLRVFAYHRNYLRRLYDIHTIKHEINKITNANAYDFVYGHGSAAGIVAPIITSKNIPYGHRLYGTFLYGELKKNGVAITRIKRHNECSVFTKKKDFLLVTDDGTNGDKVYAMLNPGKAPFDFEFWLNGIDPTTENDKPINLMDYNIDKNVPYLFYLARISRWKGQHKAIELLKKLIESGQEVKLVFSGQVIEPDYYKELQLLIKKYGLNSYVIFTGGIDKATAKSFCEGAIASLAMYDLSNRGNVFYEYLSYGAIILSLNDGSLDGFIKSGENGFLINNIEEGVEIVKRLICNNYNCQLIKKNAQDTYKAKMLSWKDRVEMELNLINRAIMNHSNNH